MEQGAILENWRFALCESQSVVDPISARELETFEAQAPGTTAQALFALGLDAYSYELDQCDAWWFCSFFGVGPHRVIFEGLTPPAEIFLDADRIAVCAAMYASTQSPLNLTGPHRLAVRFPALLKHLPQRKGRAKWRPRFIQPSDLRHIRVSALGHTPAFGPKIAPVGPWRPVRLASMREPFVEDVDITVDLVDGEGLVAISMTFAAAPREAPVAQCGGVVSQCERQSEKVFVCTLVMPEPKIWRPGDCDAAHLYELDIRLGTRLLLREKIGFRTVTLDRGADGRDFSLIVNGEAVFCRGAVWTPIDPTGLQNDPSALARQIDLVKRAGFNMLRVAGPFVYETESFYRACDEAGVLVWHDFMFANFDYPADDPEFLASVTQEANAFLKRIKKHPCLAVLCGGSEVYQQGAMLGLSPDKYVSILFETLLPNLIDEAGCKTPYVVNSPSGGDLPFRANAGVSHYYGVGAYMRPLEDARRANVRFASECLGFANIPENQRLHADFGARPLEHPLWSERIARDAGAAITFEEVRDFYLRLLYGEETLALKESDQKLYCNFSRAVVAEIAEATLGEWRRPGSTCHGALIWHWKDLIASSGWGIVDWRGAPKSIWHGARRACQPLQVVLSDEGVNGLHVHVINETPKPFVGAVRLQCFGATEQPVVAGEIAILLEPGSTLSFEDSRFWGAFFDASYAYQFGPPAHIVARAALVDEHGEMVSQAWFFPNGRKHALLDPNLTVNVISGDDGFSLVLSSDVFAQSVHIEAGEAIALDNWLHLAPGEPYVIRFLDARAPFSGAVAALGGRKFAFAAK